MAKAELKGELRKLLTRQPRYPIGFYPTPLEDVPRFSQALGGPRVLIKRDDMTGLAFGGNKARKLDFFIGEAKALGCDVLIAGGGRVQSNHARMCSAAAIKAGMKPVIVLQPGGEHYELKGNYLLTKMLLGGGVYFQEGSGSRRGGPVLRTMQAVAGELRAQGCKPYIMPSSSQPVGTLGYVECALELADQCEGMGIEPDWIFTTSTGGGQAGFLLGSTFLKETYQVVGISCAPLPQEVRANRVAGLATDTARLLGVDLEFRPTDILNYDYSGGAYGVMSPQGRETIELMMRTEAIFLDPVYTSKGMAGLVDHIRRGMVKPDETAIFVHTGGLPLIFAYAQEISKEFNLSLETDHFMATE